MSAHIRPWNNLLLEGVPHPGVIQREEGLQVLEEVGVVAAAERLEDGDAGQALLGRHGQLPPAVQPPLPGKKKKRRGEGGINKSVFHVVRLSLNREKQRPEYQKLYSKKIKL